MGKIFVGAKEYDTISLSIDEEKGILSTVVMVPEEDMIEKEEFINSVEENGITAVETEVMVTNEKSDEADENYEDVGGHLETQTIQFGKGYTAIDSVVQNVGSFYLGTDERGNNKYAKYSLTFQVVNVNINPGYIEERKEAVIKELSAKCQSEIEKGITITLSDGKEYAFSYTAADQTNIKEMFDAVTYGATAYPYHENGGNCQVFEADDIINIYVGMVKHKTHHTTYFNQLRQYVRNLDKLSDIAGIEYGVTELTGEYLETYNVNMQLAEEQFNGIVVPLMQKGDEQPEQDES